MTLKKKKTDVKHSSGLESRAVYPDSLNPDPEYGSGSRISSEPGSDQDTDPDPGF
jgi:hypothetical protein